jgi:hypothetical protein
MQVARLLSLVPILLQVFRFIRLASGFRFIRRRHDEPHLKGEVKEPVSKRAWPIHDSNMSRIGGRRMPNAAWSRP